MSEQKETNAFIKNVHLKGYKSVKDLKVRLNNGLNIIIGPNGSGKTNFVEFLSAVLKLNTDIKSKQSYFSSIIFQGKNIEFEARESYEKKLNQESFDIEDESNITFYLDNEEYVRKSIFIRLIKEYNIILNKLKPIKIPFTTPIEFEGYMLLKLGQFHIQKNAEIYIENTLKTVFENNLSIFAFNFIEKNRKIVQDDIINALKINNNLLENLKRFSPIKNLKLIDALTISVDEKSIKISNLKLEFFVNNDWFSWEQLSDGTKRIFHIISEISYYNGIIFLEEPENGVHPDQLLLLLDFLVEQSKEKQIILTTHAPEVLNVLYEDELDRIIVTRFDEETGTQMHHLSEKAKKKGKSYMKNVGFLSMFWSNSSLEKYVPEEHE